MQAKRRETDPSPEVGKDPIFFLDQNQRRVYGDIIILALEQYPPGSGDQAALRLLTSHYPGGKVPGFSARGRVAKWIREGYRHEMIISALVITSEQTKISNPFAYIEGGLLPSFRGRSGANVRKLTRQNGPRKQPGPVRSIPQDEEPPPAPRGVRSMNGKKPTDPPPSLGDLLQQPILPEFERWANVNKNQNEEPS